MEKEKEGYAKSVKSLLIACDEKLELKKCIHGVLANLISVDKQYETAIEMALRICYAKPCYKYRRRC